MIKTAVITVPDAADPVVTTEEAKVHLRVPASETGDDTYIAGLVKAATRIVESITNRKLVTQTWEYYLDFFPVNQQGTIYQSGASIELPFQPVQSVTSVKYLDADGALQTFDGSLYSLDNKGIVSQIVLEPGELWPDTEAQRVNAVTIRFVVGYGPASSVPETIKQAIKLIVKTCYDNRDIQPEDMEGDRTLTLMLADERVYTFA